MNHLIICTLFLPFALFATGQQLKAQPTTQENFLNKSKKQRTAGRTLLGVGAVFILAGIIIPEGEQTEAGLPGGGIVFPDKHKNDGIKAAFGVAGVVSAAASVPFFIASKKNRKRAVSVGIKRDRIVYPSNESLVSISLPVLTFKLNL